MDTLIKDSSLFVYLCRTRWATPLSWPHRTWDWNWEEVSYSPEDKLPDSLGTRVVLSQKDKLPDSLGTRVVSSQKNKLPDRVKVVKAVSSQKDKLPDRVKVVRGVSSQKDKLPNRVGTTDQRTAHCLSSCRGKENLPDWCPAITICSIWYLLSHGLITIPGQWLEYNKKPHFRYW